MIIGLWEENQRLEADNKALKSQISGNSVPKKTSKNSSNPPSKDQKANKNNSAKQIKSRKEGNNSRSLEPNPDQTIVARAKTCPHCGEVENPERLQALYDKI